MRPSEDFRRRLSNWLAVLQSTASGRAATSVPLMTINGAKNAVSLFERFGDEPLARAAFLSSLQEHAFLWGCEASKEKLILDGWRLLSSETLRNAATPHRTPAAILSKAQSPQSVALFINTELARVDPDGSFTRWTCEFFHQDTPPTRSPTILQPASPDQSIQEASYLRDVVAPLAEACGFWVERDVFQNVALALAAPSEFEAIVRLRHDPSVAEAARQRVRSVSELLTTSSEDGAIAVTWDWRHVASIHDKLMQCGLPGQGLPPEESWSLWFRRFGFVSVKCEDEGTCYSLLSRLHRRGRYKRNGILDFVGRETPSGYKAIHTLVDGDDDLTGPSPESEGLPVRFIPAACFLARFELAGAAQLAYLRDHMDKLSLRGIQVYTSDGKKLFLDVGATVLDFASRINPDYISLAKYAIVNGVEVRGLTAPLTDGDEVRLVIGNEAHYLPDEITEEPSDLRLRRLRRAFDGSPVVKQQRAALEKDGLKWLTARLASDGLSAAANDLLVGELLPAAIRESASDAAQCKNTPDDWRWWVRQIALLNPSNSTIEALNIERLEISPTNVSRLVNAISAMVLERLPLEDCVTLPERMARAVPLHRVCRKCGPVPAHPVVLYEESEGLVTLHRGVPSFCEGMRGTPCLTHWKRLSVRRSYYVVEVKNKPGVLRSISQVFDDFEVDILDIAGKRVSPGHGVVRVEVGFLGPSTSRRLIESLERLDQVIAVSGPSEPLGALERTHLPQRKSISDELLSATVPVPYVVGPTISDRAYFYGRKTELAELRTALADAQQEGINSGRSVFLHGPMRAGKSSLVGRFLMELRERSAPYVIASIEQARDEGWKTTSVRIRDSLHDDLVRARRYWPLLQELSPNGSDLAGYVRRLRNDAGVAGIIIAVDEVGHLYDERLRSDPWTLHMDDYVRRLTSIPGVLVLWVGPSVPLQGRSQKDGAVLALSRSKMIQLKKFTVEETADMVCARHLHLHIDASDEVIARVRYLSDGNPFYIAHLANAMWECRRPDDVLDGESTGIAHYDVAALDEAIDRLFDKALPFRARLAQLGTLEQRPYEAVLVELAREVSLSERELLWRQKKTWKAGTIRDALNALETWGYVEKGANSDNWSIRIPLLTEYVRKMAV